MTRKRKIYILKNIQKFFQASEVFNFQIALKKIQKQIYLSKTMFSWPKLNKTKVL